MRATAGLRPQENGEAGLVRLAKNGDLRAREALMSRNMGLVWVLAKQIEGPLPLEDRVQEGVMGMMRAIDRFDPERGVRFGTYAAFWIRQAVSRAMANQARTVRVPRKVQEEVRTISRKRQELTRMLGRDPTLDEVSEKSGVSTTKITRLAATAKDALSLSLLPSGGEARLTAPGDPVGQACSETTELAVMEKVKKDLVSSSLATLDGRERFVVTRRFGLTGRKEATLQEIGDELGISRERARQLQEKALGKLRRRAENGGLLDFA